MACSSVCWPPAMFSPTAVRIAGGGDALAQGDAEIVLQHILARHQLGLRARPFELRVVAQRRCPPLSAARLLMAAMIAVLRQHFQARSSRKGRLGPGTSRR